MPFHSRAITGPSAIACFFLIAGILDAREAPAGEIVVKNDSYLDGGSSVIVGDFIAGEQAGARLTSPCDGTIVAVQIVWLEGTPGHGQSLERAIHIFANGSTFPTPGSELALLEGPVMTPGYINEFRYLDEAQTMPLSVPVTLGQQFYVTLEFDNPTNVGAGGPSVIRDTNGCQAGKNVLYASPGVWMNFCLYLAGDLVIRAVVNCPNQIGSCCLTNGTCQDNKTEAQCDALGGVHKPGILCSANPCLGACCFGTGTCLNRTKSACDGMSGTWQGLGTVCVSSTCPKGACCLPNGTCLAQKTPVECSQAGGTYKGNGVTCESANCPIPTGACCFESGYCEVISESDCGLVPGAIWKGVDTTCADCVPQCDTGWHVGDFTEFGVINGRDIQGFVSAMITPPQPGSETFCRADINRDDSLNQTDVQLFVTCVLTGTCPPP